MSQQQQVVTAHLWSSPHTELKTPAALGSQLPRRTPTNNFTLLPMSPRAESFTIRALLGLDYSYKEPRRLKASPYPTVPVSDRYKKQVSSPTGSSSTSSPRAPVLDVSVPATRHQDITGPTHQDVLTTTHQESLSTRQKDVPVRVKRMRTTFTEAQLYRLEEEFHRQQYLVGPKRRYLAEQLDLTEAQLKVWFQNRRIKWRKNQISVDENPSSSPSSSGGESGQDTSSSPAAWDRSSSTRSTAKETFLWIIVP